MIGRPMRWQRLGFLLVEDVKELVMHTWNPTAVVGSDSCDQSHDQSHNQSHDRSHDRSRDYLCGVDHVISHMITV